ncbi:MAG TPA: SDR family oxidoreductase [Candidatus Binatia bacterium]
MKQLRGKKALVTGAASGIGRAIALELASQGADLYLIDVDEKGLARVASEAKTRGVEVIQRRCDLRVVQQIQETLSHVLDSWGGCDILINNAGILLYGATDQTTDDQWAQLSAVNLQAPVFFIRALLPVLLRRPEAHILNVCSIYGLVPKRRLAAYEMAKFALVGLSQSLRLEYGPRGLGITALCPGLVKTNLVTAASEQNRLGGRLNLDAKLAVSPEVVARRAIKAIQRNEGLVVVTAYAKALWFLHRCFPRLLDRWQHFKRRRKA